MKSEEEVFIGLDKIKNYIKTSSDKANEQKDKRAKKEQQEDDKAKEYVQLPKNSYKIMIAGGVNLEEYKKVF